jgi:hypothetical protein
MFKLGKLKLAFARMGVLFDKRKINLKEKRLE